MDNSKYVKLIEDYFYVYDENSEFAQLRFIFGQSAEGQTIVDYILFAKLPGLEAYFNELDNSDPYRGTDSTYFGDGYTGPQQEGDIDKKYEYDTVTVTFDAYPGSFATAGVMEQEVKVHGSYTFPAEEPTRSGYTFVGWEDDLGYPVDETTFVYRSLDHTLTAVWEENPAE